MHFENPPLHITSTKTTMATSRLVNWKSVCRILKSKGFFIGQHNSNPNTLQQLFEKSFDEQKGKNVSQYKQHLFI